jgi:hypothetical protein
MYKQQAEEFRARRQAVAEIHKQELQATPPTVRWRQFNALTLMLRALGKTVTQDEEEIAVVRRRWAELKKQYP